jgi:hypothetical protein
MSIWLVKATWSEDEAEVSEQWEMNAITAHDAVKGVTTRLRFNPHHIEARLFSEDAEHKTRAIDLLPGEARRLPQ